MAPPRIWLTIALESASSVHEWYPCSGYVGLFAAPATHHQLSEYMRDYDP